MILNYDNNVKFCICSQRLIGGKFWILDSKYHDMLLLAGGGTNLSPLRVLQMTVLFCYGYDILTKSSVKGRRCVNVPGSTIKPPLNNDLLSAVGGK